MPKYDLLFNPPLMNAAGMLGFAPDSRSPVELAQLGAFITNPVSLQARPPAHGSRYQPFAGGFLLHSGHPNPGLRAVIRRYGLRWQRASLPVLVHLLGQEAEALARMVRCLERTAGVAGIELGLPPEIDREAARQMVAAAQGELPLLVRVPLEQALALAAEVISAGAAAVSLGPPRGLLPGEAGVLVKGRLYGPALFPMALAAVEKLAKSGMPMVGAGGIYHPRQARAMLDAGALAVQLDSVLWRWASSPFAKQDLGR